MHTRRAAGVGLGLALLSAATFGTSGSFARSLTEAGWSPGAAVTVRISLAALLLAVPTVLALRGRWRALRSNLGLVAGYGLLAIVGAQLCFFMAIQYLSVGVALLLEYLGIVLIVAWLWIWQGHRPRRLTLAGSAIALLGLAFVLDILSGSRLHPIGVLWGFGSAVGLATYFVLSSKSDNDLPPVAVAGTGMGIGAVALLVLGGVGILPMQVSLVPVSFAGHSVHWLVPVIGLSLVAAVIAYVTGIEAARMLGAKLASFLGLTEVVFAVLIAWALLGELPTPVQFLGGMLIVAGVALVRIDELRSPLQQGASSTDDGTPEMPMRSSAGAL
ncbi:EamA family transporter [Actinopolymorpha alba]|uniref:EamA family transporter n=1 Tax=Actinopolymorpha alba TaxID=533267 RepID=UPI000373AD31|nr:DMT family transporter [Actinopolymorpha alba]